MEFGTEEEPGKEVKDVPAIIKDMNESVRLEDLRPSTYGAVLPHAYTSLAS